MTRVFLADRAVAVSDGRVIAVVTEAEARSRYADAQFVDLEGCSFTPGLIDSHIHLVEWAVARSQVDLSGASTIEEAARSAATGTRTGGWILGRGWNPHHWGGAYPTRAALDAVVPDVPVVLQSHDMHALWLNSAALERIGVRDASATGLLLENDAQAVVPHLPRHDADEIVALVVDAQRELHRYGITGIHSFPGVHLKEPDALSIVQLLRERRLLKLRVLQHIALDQLDDAIHLGLRSGFGDEWIRIGGVKMFLDGALGSRTAWMREPYENSRDHGVQVLPEAEFRDAVTRAARAGISSVVHAIGDAAVALAFDVLTDDAVRVPAAQHRVEHVQCLPPDFGDRLNKGVLCSVQPSHLMSDWRAADRHWGARSRRTYAFRTMLRHGATLAFGSDAPVEPADPRHGLFAAVARQDLSFEPAAGWHGEEAIGRGEALAAYTAGAQLRPGAPADFVAWKQDPLAIEPAALLTLEPAATIVAGEMVYEG